MLGIPMTVYGFGNWFEACECLVVASWCVWLVSDEVQLKFDQSDDVPSV
jgi:hypothetical protein